MLRAPLVNGHEDVMSKVYDELVTGRSSLEILQSLTKEERRLLKEYEIGWIRSIPVETAYGVLNSEYLPVKHVVVYATPEVQMGKRKWRGPWYCDATGVEHALLESDLTTAEVGADEKGLERLVRTTRLGAYGILEGPISNISEIPDIERYDESLLKKYLILKKLVSGDGDYVRYSVACLGEVEDWFEWVLPLLRKSIVSPSPPVYRLRDADDCKVVWREWLEVHGGEFEFTNEFLFEVEDRGGASSKYVRTGRAQRGVCPFRETAPSLRSG
jgi:hypothetical protein